MKYLICETEIRPEDTPESAKTYGILLLSEGKEILRVPDVSPNKKNVENLIDLLSQHGASVVHIEEIITDFIGNENFFEKISKNV